MNIPLTILTHQVTSGRGLRGGGGGKDPFDDGFDAMIFFMGVLVCVPFLLLLVVVVDEWTTIHLPKYEVDGTVVQYISKTSGKTQKIFVYLQQTDNVVRLYNTNITPRACQMAPIGTHIPVIVSPRYSKWWKTWNYTTVMKYNPCLK